MMLKDTLVVDSEKKRKYRIEIGIDISEERTQDKLIQKYRDMESLINEALKMALSADTPDETITIILEHLGRTLNGERTYIFEKNERGCDDNTYEWTAEGIQPEIDNLQNLPPEVCENWYRIFGEGKHVEVPELEEIKDSDPLQYDNLKRQGIRSIVVVPIFDEGQIIAFYGVDNPPSISLEYTSDMLQIMASFLGSCIKRRNLMRKLEDLSYKDALTHLGNRFALGKYAEQMDKNQSIGVVYCDITGLKYINDHEGHKAGDQLILKAGKCLELAFAEYGVFRIGGDELLVLCPQIAEKTLEERITLLQELMKDASVNMAVGVIWEEKATMELDTLLQESERLMYVDKERYYKEKGIQRRIY